MSKLEYRVNYPENPGGYNNRNTNNVIVIIFIVRK